MDGALKVLLLASLILLVSAQQFNNYRSLSDVLKKHVDKALKKANQENYENGHHVAYHSLRQTPTTMESRLNVNVLLKVTTCKKASEDAYEHRDECVTPKGQKPWIDCLVCKKNDGTELVDCGRLRDVKAGRHREIRKNCRSYHIGESNILAQQSLSEDNKGGCLGCM